MNAHKNKSTEFTVLKAVASCYHQLTKENFGTSAVMILEARIRIIENRAIYAIW